MISQKSKNLAAVAAALPLLSSAWAANLPPAVQWAPPETILAVEIAQPQALLDPLLSPETAQAIAALPAWQKWSNTPQFNGLRQAANLIALPLATDWQSALRKLSGGGLFLAVGPAGETLLSLDAQDKAALLKLHQTVETFVRGGAGRPNQAVTERDHGGITVFSFGPKEAHSVIDNRLLIANQPQTLERALDLRSGAAGKSFAGSAAFQAARKALGPGAVATIFANLQTTKMNPKLREALAKNFEPVPALLFHELREALKQANWLAVGFYLNNGTLTVKMVTDTPAAAARSFTMPPGANDGAMPNLTVPDSLASVSLYRDLKEFYAAKDELFPERTSGLVFFENMMGIFFSGRHLTEGVLGEIQPDIRLVAAPQQYDPAIGTPSVKFPAFALVMRMRHPQEFGEVVEEAWQKAIGMASFTRGQKALPGFIIDRIPYGDIKLSVASFRPPPGPDRSAIDVRYNFRPTLARTGEYVIFSSADGLAKQLVDAVKREAGQATKPLPRVHSLVEIQGSALLSATLANWEAIARKNMIDKGTTREQAESQVEGLLTVLDCLQHGRLTFCQEGGHPLARLELKLKLPGAEHLKTATANRAPVNR